MVNTMGMIWFSPKSNTASKSSFLLSILQPIYFGDSLAFSSANENKINRGVELEPIRPPSEANQITPDNVEQFTAEVMKRFI